MLALLALDAGRAPVRAQRPSVALTITGECEAIDGDVVLHVLEVELGGEAVLSEGGDASSLVEVRCEGTRVRVEIDERLTRKELRRELELEGATREVGTRLVGLAIAELLAAAWLELGMRHDPAVEAALAPVEDGGAPADVETGGGAREGALRIVRDRWVLTAPEPSVPEAPPARPLAIRVLGAARLSNGEPQHVALGGGLALGLDLLPLLALTIDVRADHASDDVYDVGSVAITSATLGVVLAARVPIGDESHIELGGGARSGAGWLEGRSGRVASAATHVGPLVSIVGVASLATRITGDVSLYAALELGWVVVPVFGTLAPNGETIARIGDAQAAIALGLELRPEL